MKKTLLTISTIVGSCFFVEAATASADFSPVVKFIGEIQKVLDRLVPFLISLAVLGLFYFMLQFIWKGADNPEERNKARVGVGWSLVAIFLMVGIWGVISFVAYSIGITPGGEMGSFKLPGE
jgi:Na+/H+-dicarboxylate symporter